MSKPPTPKPAKSPKSAKSKRSPNRDIVGASVAVGIGSAAVAAALLYAGKLRRDRELAAEHALRAYDAIERRFLDET